MPTDNNPPGPATPAPAQVSRGLNLWLELKDPSRMPQLLAEIAMHQKRTRELLLQQGNVHFARFLPSHATSVVAADGSTRPVAVALQVITEFDGDLDAYALDFVFTIGAVFDLILAYIVDAPPLPVRDHPAEFLNFIRKCNRIPVGKDMAPDWSLFSAYPQHTVLDLLGSSKSTRITVQQPAEQVVDFADVQANVLRGVNCAYSSHFCLTINDAAMARLFLRRLLTGDANTPRISSAQRHDVRPAWFLNLGLTYRGLLALGLGEAERKTFASHFPAFVDGPEHYLRARRNGDMFSSHPDTWVLGGTNHQTDFVLSLYSDDVTTLKNQTQALERSWTSCALALLLRQDAAVLDDNKVHFGYRDGLSQPRLAIKDLYPHGSKSTSTQPAASAGSFLLGPDYTNVYGGTGSLGGLPGELATNATFAAVRLMRQDVAAFESLLIDAVLRYGHLGVTRHWLAARLMGRWPDGTPTSLSSDPASAAPNARDSNNFDYAPSLAAPDIHDDHTGARCPIGAHIRRMNPRSSRVAGMPHTRRLIRRGMPYGLPLDQGEPNEERGLLGIFICADLERQYEFLLYTWANSDFFASGIKGTQDPMIGAQSPTGVAPMTGEFRCLAPDGKTPVTLQLPRLVHTRGGLYLMMPGLNALAFLAKGTTPAPAPPTAHVPPPMPSPAPPPPHKKPPNNKPPFDPSLFDPRDKAFLRDPYTTYARIHQSVSPAIAYIGSVDSTWVFGHDLIQEVCEKPTVFFKREDPLIGPAGILTMDYPAHGAVRSAIYPLFDKAIRNARTDATHITAELMQSFGAGPVDWVRAFARPLSQRLYARVLEIDANDMAELLLRVEMALSAHNPHGTARSSAEFAYAIKVVGTWFTSAGDKTSNAPSHLVSFLQALARMPQRDTQANKHALEEFAANAACLALSGFKPLEWLTSLVTYHLLKNDADLLKVLRQRQQERRLDYKAVINEMVRFDTPLPLANRYTRSATMLGGVALPSGTRLTLAYAAANRDPRFPHADQIDFDRPAAAGPGLGFGHGARECLGHALAHRMLEPVMQALVDAPGLPRLAPGFEPQLGGNPFFRFLHHLDIVL
jgi:cytochrome P450/deferrochelatase/peroxidase EfeB